MTAMSAKIREIKATKEEFGSLVKEALEDDHRWLHDKVIDAVELQNQKAENHQLHNQFKKSTTEWKSGKDGGMVYMHPDSWWQKAITTAGGNTIPGSPKVSLEPSFARPNMTPGLLDLVDVKLIDGRNEDGRASGGDAFYVPDVSGFELTKENVTPTGPRTPAGSLTSATVVVDTYVAELMVSGPAMNDVPGLHMSIQEASSAFGRALLEKLAMDKLIGISSSRSIATGKTAALPAKDEVWGKLAALIETIPAAYRGGNGWALIISRAMETLLRISESTGGQFVATPQNAIRQLSGVPVVVSDHLADGSTAGDISAVIGDCKQIVVGIREQLNVQYFSATHPGALTVFSRMRAGCGVRQEDGLARLTTGS